MKKMIIYEPAMCCQSGVCGPAVDPELLRVSTVINNLKNKGVSVERYNLSSNPQVFVDHKVINEILMKEGVESFPVVVVDDQVVKTKAYPTNEEFCAFLEIPETYVKATASAKRRSCGRKDESC